MQETEKGPLLTDETFFHNCLDLGRQEMKEVRYFAENHDYVQARRALAAVLRSGLASRKERFFAIPYEEPENVWKYPYETDREVCERLQRHGWFYSFVFTHQIPDCLMHPFNGFVQLFIFGFQFDDAIAHAGDELPVIISLVRRHQALDIRRRSRNNLFRQ